MKKATIYENKAFQRGLRELKVKDVPEVKATIIQILGVSTQQSFNNYAAGRVKNLDVDKAGQITRLFARFGVSNPWGL